MALGKKIYPSVVGGYLRIYTFEEVVFLHKTTLRDSVLSIALKSANFITYVKGIENGSGTSKL